MIYKGRDGLLTVAVAQIGILSTYISGEGGSEDHQGEDMLSRHECDKRGEGPSGSMGGVPIA